ncbi:RAP domain-containing protein [Haematococcus lacustris]|uniref:RAP domain-containing protein n=1 Tax=Haematococcus lacustris TaxID=44745 RepID=A0A699YI17_HAELA|nr:RAP domain-containing protein [Haematococcus lacustris]
MKITNPCCGHLRRGHEGGSLTRADSTYDTSRRECADPAMQSLLLSRPGLSIGWGLRPDSLLRSPAPRTCQLPWLPITPSRTLRAAAHTLRQYDPAPRPKQNLEELVSAVKELPFLRSSSQVEQTSQLLWCCADWARQPENRIARMTQAQWNSVLDLLQRMAGEARACKAGNPPVSPPLQQFDARQLSMAAWSLGKLKPHLPAAAVTSACTALASHSASSEAMKRGNWRDWSSLLHGLATAGMQCSISPDLTRLCHQAVQLLPLRMAWGVADQAISMSLLAMAKSGYAGSAQPLLKGVTAAISQGEVMRDAKPQDWANLIWAASKLPGCREEARQLLSQFAIRGMMVVAGCNAQNVSNILYAMSLVLWHDKEVCKQLAERAAQTQQAANGQDLANSLYALARLGYLDSSVRSLAAAVANADLAAFTAQAIANLLYARSMFLALSIHQAVSSGHSQLGSEPQLNSMAAALWRECSRRGQSEELWGKENPTQLQTASQWLHACTGGQISLAASPALPELFAVATAIAISSTKKVQNSARQVDCCQLVQALAAAGYGEAQQASLSQLQQMTHFDAGVIVNKAVFEQLASDSERAAFMREQVRASLPEAEAWRQLLQAEGGHCAAACISLPNGPLRWLASAASRGQLRDQPCDGPGPFVTSISLAVLKTEAVLKTGGHTCRPRHEPPACMVRPLTSCCSTHTSLDPPRSGPDPSCCCRHSPP